MFTWFPAKRSLPSGSPAHSTRQLGYIRNEITGAAPENYSFVLSRSSNAQTEVGMARP